MLLFSSAVWLLGCSPKVSALATDLELEMLASVSCTEDTVLYKARRQE